jgi:Amt family ammonium transporter
MPLRRGVLHRGVLIPFVALGLLVLVAYPAMAQAAPSDGERVLPYLATWLLPLGLTFLAVGARHPARAHHAATALPLALALAVGSYYVCGFALHFGGVGLVSEHPDLAHLLAEWSPLDLKLGPGWGLIGLRGFFLSEDVVYGEGLWLFVAQLPLVTTAALLPLLTLNGRVPRLPLLVLAGLTAAICYPLMGNWVRGGGWLSQLGVTVGWGHGYVDFGVTSLFLVGSGAALAGMVTLRGRCIDAGGACPDAPRLPPSYLPLHVLLGGFLALGGWLATVLHQPLVPSVITAPALFTRALLATGGAALAALLYGWLVRGDPDPALAGRAMLAALVAVGAGLPFLPLGVVVVLGILAGLALAPLMYLVEQVVQLEDPAASVSVGLFPAVAGILAVGLFANGREGVAWNLADATLVGGLVPHSVLAHLGSTGVDAGAGQLWAQAAGVGALLLLGGALPLVLMGLVARAYTLPGAMVGAAQSRAAQVQHERAARDAVKRQGGGLSLWQQAHISTLHASAGADTRLMRRRRPPRGTLAHPATRGTVATGARRRLRTTR